MTRDLTFRRRMPKDFNRVPINVSTAGGLKYLLKPMRDTDPDLLRMARLLIEPGAVVWDVGANIGLFSVAAAYLAGRSGRVLAFEPDPWLVRILRKSVKQQPMLSAPIDVIPLGLASNCGFRQFNVARRARAMSSLDGYGYAAAKGSVEKFTIPVRTLDDLLRDLPAPNVLKCDVEGAEIEVFDAQSEMLGSVRPAIVCEIGQENVERMTRIFQTFEYRLFEWPIGGTQPIPSMVASWNTIAIPSEQSRFR